MNHPQQNKAFFTVRELAEYLAVRVKTVYSWAESGRIPAYKLNGALRFNVGEITAFVASGKVIPKDPEREAKIILGKRLLRSHNRHDSGQKTPRRERSSHV